MKLDELREVVIQLRTVFYVGFTFMLVISIGSVSMSFSSYRAVMRVANERPIVVVPGAVAGEYISGLGEENILGAARYVSSLCTAFNTSNYEARCAEFLAYAAPSYETLLKSVQDAQRKEVQATGQSRSFNFDRSKESIKRIDNNTFVYTAVGDRTVFSAGLVVSQDQAQIRLVFTLTGASDKNRYGITMTGFEITPFKAVTDRAPTK